MDDLLALVVDDDSFVRRVLARQLGALGIADVLQAADGGDALQLLSGSRRIDLVICDLMMPGFDGVRFLRELQRLAPDVPLILISGLERKVLMTAAQAARARGLRVLGALSKPVSKEALQNLLAQLSRNPAAPVAESHPPIDAAELQQAIDDDEIVPFVQPQVAARSRRPHGAEALARWLSPTRGIVEPGDFIGVAERSGLLDALSHLMLRKAIDACGIWHRQGLELRVSVNVPVSLLEQIDLPDRLARLARAAGLDPQHLVVEITESSLMRGSAQALDVLARLRIHGVELSIDDFGTGYSMLGLLKQAPFTEMKIDQSFAAAAVDDREALHIVESSLRLARDLGLRTVAEGVADDAVATLMTRLGCDLLQGYCIARPMPVEQLAEWCAGRGVA